MGYVLRFYLNIVSQLVDHFKAMKNMKFLLEKNQLFSTKEEEVNNHFFRQNGRSVQIDRNAGNN